MKNYRIIVFTCRMAYTYFIQAQSEEIAKTEAIKRTENALPMGAWIYKNMEIVEEVA